MDLSPESAHQWLVALAAYQKGILDQVQFVEACSAWAAEPGQRMRQVLEQKGWVEPDQQEEIENEVQRLLEQHDGDARACLNHLMDDQVRDSLSHISLPPFIEPRAVEIVAKPRPKAIDPTMLETERPPSLIRDRYTLVGELGSGGIGQVWRAFDPHLGREVALKELKPECAKHESHRARFLAEAKITAQLIHPNIVPAFEMVDEKDRPFYTMQLVQGRTLTDVIKQYHEKLRKKEAGPLELRKILSAFLAVCRAVDYAHDRGVLHRDLKGPNIILGDHGEVFLLDWGMAKVLKASESSAALQPPVQLNPGDSDAETVLGQQLGTPLYMAPEQAAGRIDLIDRRTDVYALGVILYEILSGAFPFTVSSEPPPDEDLPERPAERMVEWNRRKKQKLYHKIQFDSPPPPRAMNAIVVPALEAICLKCLSKKHEDRYPTAAALAGAVERWLADEPVDVYQDSLFVRALRFARRRRVLVATVGALILAALPLLVSLLLVMERGHTELLEEKKKTENALELAIQRESEAAEAAEKNKELAENNKMLFERSQEQIKEVRESLKNLVAMLDEELSDQPGTSTVRKQLLEDATARLERAFRRADIRVETDVTSLEAWNSLGRVFLSAGSPLKAKEAFDKVDDATKNWLVKEPRNVKARRLRAVSLGGIGEALVEMGDRIQGHAYFQEALELHEQLAKDDLDGPHSKAQLIRNCHLLGQFELDQERPGDALRHFLRARDESRRLLDHVLEKPAQQKDARCLVSASHRWLAKVYLKLEQPEKAHTSLKDAFAHLAPFKDSERPGMRVLRDYAACLDALGELCLQQEEYAKAEKAFNDGSQIRFNLWHIDQTDPVVSRDLALSFYWIGVGREKQGRLSGAEDAFRKQLERHQVMSNTGTLHTLDPLVWSYFHLGRVQAQMGKVEEARKNLGYGLTLLEREQKAANPDPRRVRRKCDCLLALVKLERARFASEDGKRYLEAIPRPAPAPGVAQAVDPLEMEKESHLKHCERVKKALDDLEWAAKESDAAELLLHRAAANARLDRYEQAAASVERLVSLGEKSPRALFQAAMAFALCHDCACQPLPIQPAPQLEKWQKQFATRAIDLLKKLDGMAYFDDPTAADELRFHFAFERLRSHREFLKLQSSGSIRPAQ